MTAGELARLEKPDLLRARLATLEQLLDVYERTAMEQSARLERANEALTRQTSDLEAMAMELQAQSEELQNQMAQLEETQAELEMANDELQRATEEAEDARAEAEQANRAKGEFLAAMSHELRTPLNAISGYTELLEMGIHGPVNAPQRETLSRIAANQRHLLALINDILQFAKIEAGKMEYDLQDVSVDGAMKELEALVGPQLRAKELMYEYVPGPSGTRVRADPERLRQIMLNLLTNAVKFTDAEGRIRVRWEARDGRIRIDVEDTGRGIPAEKLASVFDPFVQVGGGSDNPAQGVGLGLAISRDMARAMAGDLTVESEPGRGSAFTLELPQVSS